MKLTVLFLEREIDRERYVLDTHAMMVKFAQERLERTRRRLHELVDKLEKERAT